MQSKRFGKYQLLMELGRGGMATVYLAVSRAGIQDVRKFVVIKLLNENLRTDAEFVEMFAREARIAAELSHPNVVLTHTVGQEEGRYYIAMEYLEGVTLRDIMRESGEWPLQDRLPLFGAMCLALAGLGYVHDFRDHNDDHLALIHRDLKPDNIFITTTGQVKLLDFGVAKASAAGFEPTLGINVRGTVQYLPPEATKADAVVDQRWDLFSAGVILAELATGRRYWDGMSITQIISRLASDDLPIPSRGAEEEIPPVLKRVLERALQPDPIARYQSSLELCKAIQSFLTRQAYRVGVADLQRIVGHLYEPIRAQREEVIRLALEEMDRTRRPSGAWGGPASASASDHGVPTPPGPVRVEDTAPTVEVMDQVTPPSPPSRLWIAAALLLLVAVTVVWFATRDRIEPTDSRVAETNKEGPGDAKPTASPPSPVAETTVATPVAVPPRAPATASVAVESPIVETPEPPTPATVTPATTPSAAAIDEPPATTPASSTRNSRSRKSKRSSSSSSSSRPDDEKADSDAPKPAPAGKKLELEPSPYTR